ncbi:sensor histidine kinase [Nocardioides sp. YIM 152315]|uniref:sensor histidine kinase n=1 Tax=Nocardioides sp. YIM 152315 TaxID=3031760 RepID=UPI0023DA99A4|nr:sensor histidine kinase [Nocardioides sp. YIM 152315]MDF1602159.1 sensor histidine kinase [Nocardioides sp. YIM 152315]
MRLYWKVVLINGAVLAVATLLLVLGPFSVSRHPVVSEAVVLGVGLLVMLVTNSLLLRSSFKPIEKVVAEYDAMFERLEDERAASSARALAAQEAERHRIARELHDDVGQQLTVVLLGLKQLEQRVPPELADELAALRESTRDGLDDVRRVVRRLRPGVLEDLGLPNALASLANDFAEHSSASVRRVVTPGLPPLSPEAELVVYRVAQEALTNAARHAHADGVELSLTRVGDRVALVVADDGRGFDTRTDGDGLRGMRERARLAHGELAVTSSPAGTTVRLEVPSS